MADEKTTPQGVVDPDSVKVEDLELTEQQLRLVTGGKGMGRVGSLFSRPRVGTLATEQLNQIDVNRVLNQ